MAKNTNLQNAKSAKKDEFYTQLPDIERELRHYRQHFKDKVVFCNCDDPRVSNFFKYFVLNFDFLGLKEVIATCYKNQDADLFSENNSETAVYLSVTPNTISKIRTKYGNITVDTFKDIKAKPLKGDGDFRSLECIEFLNRSDIVCTNPPFSLFREYVGQLIKYEKKFLIIGHQNAITYKEIFPLIKDKKVWLGYGFPGNAGFFINPHYEDYATASTHKEGMIRVSGVTWFTNLDHQKRHEPLVVYKKYDSSEYPKYENYDAIEVSKTSEIPVDYKGVMGVPITFLDKYCPEQFEILGMCENEDLYSLKTKTYTTQQCKEAYFAKFGKSGTYDLNASGVLLKKGLLEKTYQRILIKYR